MFVPPRYNVGDLVQLSLPVQLQLFKSEFSDFSENSVGVIKEVIKRESEFQTLEYTYIVFIEGNDLMFFEYEISRLGANL